MKKSYDKNKIDKAISKSKYAKMLQDLNINLFLIQYEKGEAVTSPYNDHELVQIVVDGKLSIFAIRDDGSRYSLATGGRDYMLGDMDLFIQSESSIYTEASTRLTCIAIPVATSKEQLLASCEFLQAVCYNLSSKMVSLTHFDTSSSSLVERVISYMN